MIALLGGPGLLVGALRGALLARWKVVIALIAVGAVAMATNFGGWVVGLTAGAATARVLRRRKS
jgi:hypothetical protein